MALAMCAGVGLGGCSFSYKLGSIFDKTPEEVPETTGSINPGPRVQLDAIPEIDLAYARAAAVDVVASGQKDASQSWENPRTGARGTVTPLATISSAEGGTCRDFLASYVQGQSEAWWQGEACRFQQGRWEVRSMKPWKRT